MGAVPLLTAAWAVATLVATAQAPAAPVEGEVVMTSRHGLTLVGRGSRREVIRLERGGLLLGAPDVTTLPHGETVRYVPGALRQGVRTVGSIELLPSVWTDDSLLADVRELLTGDDWARSGPRPTPVDVRERGAFARGHIEGALSAPDRRALEAALPHDPNASLVFYGDSHQDRRPVDAVRAALALGHKNARVFRGGIREWEAAVRPTFVAAEELARWLESENTLVLDVRPPEEVALGTLPRAIATAVAALKNDDVAGFAMPVFVVVGRDARDPAVAAAAEKIRRLQPDGFRQQVWVKILDGGVDAWRRIGRVLVPAAASREAVPCIAEIGAVCPSDFMRWWRADGGQSAPLIVDVRDLDHPRPAWALHIPISQLGDRLAELPRNREIVTFCRMGYTSRIAQQLLLREGFRVRALLVPEPDGL